MGKAKRNKNKAARKNNPTGLLTMKEAQEIEPESFDTPTTAEMLLQKVHLLKSKKQFFL